MYIYCCCTADCGTDHQLFTGKFRLKLKKTTRTVRSKLNPLCVCVCVCVCVCDFPGGSDGKASAYNVGDLGSIPGSGRAPGEGNGNPLQYSRWKIPWTEKPGKLQPMGSERVGHD